MIILRPDLVTFAGAEWPGVERLSIDRVATRVVKAWSDDGPHAVFVDVPEQLVRVRITQPIDQTSLASPLPGNQGQLRIEPGRGADEGRKLIRIEAVIESVTHEITARTSQRTVSLIAVSPGPNDDPVLITDAS